MEGLAEILNRISNIPDVNKRVQELSKYQNYKPILYVLETAFNMNIIWDLPETDPPYKPLTKKEDAQNVLTHDVRKFPIFMANGEYAKLDPKKRQTVFIELLENVDPDDAILLLAIKNKTIPYKGITEDVVKAALPSITGKWRFKK